MIDLKSYFHDKYQGGENFIENVILPIFGEDKYEDAYEEDVLENNPELTHMADTIGISQILRLGTINIPMNPTDVFDITVSNHVQMERNRVTIQQLVRRIMSTFSSAFMVFHYDDDTRWDWRFTFCSKQGNNQESTDSKRYTFLLGPNQSCRTAAENFKKLASKYGELELDDIVKAFDVESLSKEFFEKYKVRYGRFVGHVIGKEYIDKGDGKGEWKKKDGLTPSELFYGLHEDEKVARDYVKKLLGRIVFLHFLQKKGWLGATDEKWTNGPQDFMHQLFENATANQKENFLDEILEPLFSCLDTPLNQRREVFDTKVDGLRVVRVPFLGGLFERTEEDKVLSIFPAALFADLFKFLSEYNFTIDENDPNDAQVGVDPEMLGRIFENLLEDNKDKGAFYTPKEIVQYMCRESLIAYLQTDVTDEPTREALRQFVTSHDVTLLGGRGSALAQNVSQCLKDVKICDPAIGSGAFPMGLLNELFLCRGVIEDFSNAAQIKRHIIQQNIYGVDIEKGAVEIARLRFCLSLIMDADKPDVLPNMDFKIMQGNSLLEQYKGIQLDDIYRKGDDIKLAFDEITNAKNDLVTFINEYFMEESHERRNILRIKIDNAVRALVKAKTFGNESIDNAIESLDFKDNTEFFLWHTWFSDVFAKGGFDIVIGNPPYLFLSGKGSPVQRMRNEGRYEEAERLQDLFDTYAKVYPEVSKGCRDFYKWFYKLAINLANSGGIVSYITPDTFFNMPKYRDLREQIFTNEALYMYDLGFSVFDAPTVSTGISLLRKDSTSDNVDYSDIKMLLTKDNRYMLQSLIEDNKINAPISECEMAAYKHPLASNIYNSNSCVSASTYLRFIEGEHGIHIDTDELYENKGHGLVPVLVDTMLERNGFVPMYYIESECPISEIHKGERGILRKTGDTIVCSVPLSDAPAIAHQNVYVVRPLDTKYPMIMWMALLNSKLLTFLYQNGLFGQKGRTMAQFRVYALDALPMPAKLNKSICNKIKDLIMKVLDHEGDKATCEHEIDRLVYALYGLTEDEVAIVEGTN